MTHPRYPIPCSPIPCSPIPCSPIPCSPFHTVRYNSSHDMYPPMTSQPPPPPHPLPLKPPHSPPHPSAPQAESLPQHSASQAPLHGLITCRPPPLYSTFAWPNNVSPLPPPPPPLPVTSAWPHSMQLPPPPALLHGLIARHACIVWLCLYPCRQGLQLRLCGLLVLGQLEGGLGCSVASPAGGQAVAGSSRWSGMTGRQY